MVQGRAKRCKSDSGPAHTSDAKRHRQRASAYKVGNGPYKTFAGSVCAAAQCFRTRRSCPARHCRTAKGCTVGEDNTPSIVTGQSIAPGGSSMRLSQKSQIWKTENLVSRASLASQKMPAFFEQRDRAAAVSQMRPKRRGVATGPRKRACSHERSGPFRNQGVANTGYSRAISIQLPSLMTEITTSSAP